jgi:hypothetical protein
MNRTNTNANSESMMLRELRATIHEELVLGDDENLTSVNPPRSILRSALAALSEGRISEAVAQFDDRFKFNDHALTLEFTEKTRLTEFLDKCRELFPDTTLNILSIFDDQDHAIAQWELSANQTVPYGSITYRFPISLQGSTIIRVAHNRIVEWSDYYDQGSSRVNLAASFTEWIDY